MIDFNDCYNLATAKWFAYTIGNLLILQSCLTNMSLIEYHGNDIMHQSCLVEETHIKRYDFNINPNEIMFLVIVQKQIS